MRDGQDLIWACSYGEERTAELQREIFTPTIAVLISICIGELWPAQAKVAFEISHGGH